MKNLGIKHGLKNSFALHKRSEKVIPAASQLLSRGPYVYPFGAYPIYVDRGRGSHVWDVDGNEYIEWQSAIGPNILGYGLGEINEAIIKQLEKGAIFNLEGRLQVELAELLNEIIPTAEMVRFGKNGSDVTSMAVKCARAYTGREKIAYCGYHGWEDWFVATAPPKVSKGVPKVYKKLIVGFKYNDIESLEKVFASNKNKIAAVIMEPVHSEAPNAGFLQKVKQITHKNGALLIFDEVFTGFRFGLGGAQEHFNVMPDLSTFSKAIANGLPLAALVGKKEFMKEFKFGGIFFSSTFGSELVSMAAAVATIKFMKKHNVAKRIWDVGSKLKHEYNCYAKELEGRLNTSSNGLPPALYVSFKKANGERSLEAASYFMQETVKKGVMFGLGQYPNFAHTNEDLDYTLRTVKKVLRQMAEIGEKNIKKHLKGDVMRTVF